MKGNLKLLFMLLFFGYTSVLITNAQPVLLSGTVRETESNEPLVGVSISIKGSTTGTITDADGKYQISVNTNDILVFSSVGYLNEEVVFNGQTILDVSLILDLVELEELVVIGYGVQKKKLNTGATVNVKGEDIQKLNTPTAMDALKGISAGVSIIQNNGMPGSGTRVLIRGAGTIDDPDPLYVVDGVTVDDIDFLAPSDIESIDILKDAASAAIYGSRAANGVILVTTKKGSVRGKPSITYDFYHGWSRIAKKPNLLNAQQYVDIMNEAYENSGLDRPDWEDRIPNWEEIASGQNKGVNWLDEIYNENAPVQSHAITVAGGNESSVYSMGFNYLREEGILGKQVNNVYKRINFRLNSEHLLIERGGMSLLKIGQNLTFSNFSKPAFRTGGIYWNDLRNMIITSPLLPMYAEDENDPAYPYHYATRWNAVEVNPIAQMEIESKHSTNNNNSVVGNIYAELQIIKNLVIRSSFGINSWFGVSRNWKPQYELGRRTASPRDQVDQDSWLGYTWTFTNTITYSNSLFQNHNLSVVLGQESQKNVIDNKVSGHNENSIFQDYERAYLDNVAIVDPTYTRVEGRDDHGWGLLSYFGRLSYDYKQTLLATFVLRADGSSMFPKENRWGTFPSVSLGYVLSNHSFMQNIPGMSYFKIRGSWGQNGNQNIRPFQYLSTLSYENAEYFAGIDKTVRQLGAWPARVPNPDIMWETSEQTSLGFDANFLANRLQFNFDWYQKLTKDWLVLAPIRATDGTDPAYINGGEITNKGIEMVLKWKEQRSDFNYSVLFSFTHNKNEITRIANGEGIIHGEIAVLSQGTSELYRAQVGYPIGYFRGYVTDGVLQNDEEVAAYVSPAGQPYFNNSQPGDVRFVNQNGDSQINDDDKVMIGDPNPDYILGFQFNLSWKGIYFLISADAQLGHQVAKAYRSSSGPKENYTDDAYDRWHGEGTSDRMPRLLAEQHPNNQYVSDLFIEDADFLRINNITLGYDLNRLWKSSPLKQTRIYLTGKNLFTFTKYSGMDPEVGYAPDDWASGVDLGLYPAAKTYMIGLSVNF